MHKKVLSENWFAHKCELLQLQSHVWTSLGWRGRLLEAFPTKLFVTRICREPERRTCAFDIEYCNRYWNTPILEIFQYSQVQCRCAAQIQRHVTHHRLLSNKGCNIAILLNLIHLQIIVSNMCFFAIGMFQMWNHTTCGKFDAKHKFYIKNFLLFELFCILYVWNFHIAQ